MVAFSYSIYIDETLDVFVVNQLYGRLLPQLRDTLSINAVRKSGDIIFRIVVYVLRLRTRL